MFVIHPIFYLLDGWGKGATILVGHFPNPELATRWRFKTWLRLRGATRATECNIFDEVEPHPFFDAGPSSGLIGHQSPM